MFVSRHCLISIIYDVKVRAQNTGDVEAGRELIVMSSDHNTTSNTSNDSHKFHKKAVGGLSRQSENYGRQYVSACITDNEGEDEDSYSEEEYDQQQSQQEEEEEKEVVIAFSSNSFTYDERKPTAVDTDVAFDESDVPSAFTSRSSSIMEVSDGAIIFEQINSFKSPPSTRDWYSVENLHHNITSFMKSSQNNQHVAVTLVLWLSTTVLAMIFDDLGIVLSLTGSIAASCLGYILPGIIFLSSYQEELSYAIAAVRDRNANHYERTIWGKIQALYQFYIAFLLIGFGTVAALFGVGTVLLGKGGEKL